MKYGRFWDPYRGGGYFVSFRVTPGFLLFAVRLRWHFYTVDLDNKRRWYIGPFEIEKYKRSALVSGSREDGAGA